MTDERASKMLALQASDASNDSGREPTATRLDVGDRLQPLLLLASIGVGLLIGGVTPDVGDAMASGVSIGVFVLIALVMLGVSPRGVAAAFTQRRFLAAAIGLNFVVNPLLAWGLGAVFLGGQPDLRVGLILFLVTPCIGWYLVFTELAGGDTELGVGLLGVNVVLQVVLLPVYLGLFVGDASATGASTIVRSVVLYLVLPALVASALRRWAARSSSGTAAEPGVPTVVPVLKTVALVVVLVSMFASHADRIFDELDVVGRLFAPMVSFFALAFVIAVAVARVLDMKAPQTALLVFTTASRNSEASLAIAATAFTSPLVGLTVALGPVIELPLLIVMVRILRTRT